MPLNFLSIDGITHLMEIMKEVGLRLTGLHAARMEYAPAYFMAILLVGAMLVREELQVRAIHKPTMPARRRHSGRGMPVRRRNELVDA